MLLQDIQDGHVHAMLSALHFNLYAHVIGSTVLLPARDCSTFLWK